jgi:2'-deoxynucleoside 5'-phosphate N-hydrolase
MREERVYISGPLTTVRDPLAARALYEHIAEACSSVGLSPYLPHLENDPKLHPGVPAAQVYESDLRHLLEAQLVVADIGAASLGVGAELAIASMRTIPIVAFFRPGEQVSRFILGMLRASAAQEIVASEEDFILRLPIALRLALADAKRVGVT